MLLVFVKKQMDILIWESILQYICIKYSDFRVPKIFHYVKTVWNLENFNDLHCICCLCNEFPNFSQICQSYSYIVFNVMKYRYINHNKDLFRWINWFWKYKTFMYYYVRIHRNLAWNRFANKSIKVSKLGWKFYLTKSFPIWNKLPHFLD